MATYVKGPGKDTWHWCKNCSNYPQSIGHTSPTKPTSGELCNECRAKEAAGTCTH